MKVSELKQLIKECLSEMTNLDLSSMNEKSVKEASRQYSYDVYLNGKLIDTVFANYNDVEEMKQSLINHDGYDYRIKVKLNPIKEDVITNTDPVIMKTWDRHSSQFNKTNFSFTECYEAYEQGFLDGYEHAEKKHGIQQ